MVSCKLKGSQVIGRHLEEEKEQNQVTQAPYWFSVLRKAGHVPLLWVIDSGQTLATGPK
jgi:hypothetical protein